MRLKVLLINPPRVKGMPVVREERYEHRDMGSVYPPLSLLQGAAALRRSGFEVHLLDANGFNLKLEDIGRALTELQPHLVVTRLAFDCQEEDLKVLQMAKAAVPHCVTLVRSKIMSDVAFLLDPLSRRPEVDLCLMGEPDAVLSPLARALESAWTASGIPTAELHSLAAAVPGLAWAGPSGLQKSNPAPLTDVASVPFPAYDLLPSIAPYHTGVFPDHFAMIQTSRGCPFGCTFCAFAEEKYRPRPDQQVSEELRWLRDRFGVKNVLFFDDLLALNSKRTLELAQTLVKDNVGLDWVCCTRANLTDVASLKMMKDSGCKELAVGIESGSDVILKEINKGVSKDDIRACAAACKEAGVLFYGMTIVGLPGETRETWRETIDFIKEIDPFYTQFCFSTPFPNTEMYPWYEKRNLLLHKDWSKYSPLAPEPVIRTEALSAQDLIELRREAYREVIFRPKYLLSKIKWNDPKWTVQGAAKIAGRGLALLSGRDVR